jgi:hypothetical protein
LNAHQKGANERRRRDKSQNEGQPVFFLGLIHTPPPIKLKFLENGSAFRVAVPGLPEPNHQSAPTAKRLF